MSDLPDLIDSPAAWFGRDLVRHPEHWVHAFTEAEISELEAAAEGFLKTANDIGEITAQRFALPTLGPWLEDLREQLQHGIGFSLIRGLPIERLSIETAAAIFCGIGSHLGIARSQNAKGHMLGHVTDVGADLSDPNVRIYQTSERQTFHTDSCDCVGLLCLREAMEGGDSLLVSTVTLYNEMRRRAPELADALFEPVPTDRRGEVPDGQKPYFEIPVLSWYGGNLTGLYQRTYINSSQRFVDAPRLTDIQIAALDLFDDIANDPEVHLRMRLAPGDMQFVYNHTLLHDRTGFRDWPEPDKRRYLLRLWLALPDDRALPPAFKQRYGRIDIGDRGGIITSKTELHVSLVP
ncbi:MAG: TauD/TfdA family dioxygenase [Pseudomonadota bacterium]